MIKEKIGRVIHGKFFGLILIIIINISFFILCNILFEPKYEQVDDFIIMNLISKSDGNYSIYGIQMHPLICGIIILLYKTAIDINWYTVFLLIMQFISFTIIGTVFTKKNKNISIPLYITFIFIMYSKMLSYIQYTTVSMLCIASGFILLMYSIEDINNIKKSSFVIAMLIIALGVMIRFSTIIIAIPFMLIYFMCKIIKDKNLRILKIALMLILSLLVINLTFNIIYNINPVYDEFLKFHDARTYLHDYNWMNYELNQEIFDSVNWTKNDRDIFYGYCFGDENIFNAESLERLRENALSKNNNVNIIKRTFNTFESFTDSVKSDTYKFVFLVSALLVISNNLLIINSKSHKNITDKDASNKIVFVNLIFISMIVMHCLFIFLNRPMFRVVISIYIIGIPILIYSLIDKFKINKKQVIKCILIVCILIISMLELKQNINFSKRYNKDYYSVYKDIVNYTSSHKENAYLYTLVMHDRFLGYSVYEKIPDDSYINLRPLGDWDTYTENYYNFKERYNIENLFESLYKNDNVYLISGDVIWGENYKEYINIIVKYIKEHYKIDVKYDIVKEFDNNIKIYKLEQ